MTRFGFAKVAYIYYLMSLSQRHALKRMSHLTNCNFTVRMLFYDSYWLYSLYSLSCILPCISLGHTIAVWQLFY